MILPLSGGAGGGYPTGGRPTCRDHRQRPQHPVLQAHDGYGNQYRTSSCFMQRAASENAACCVGPPCCLRRLSLLPASAFAAACVNTLSLRHLEIQPISMVRGHSRYHPTDGSAASVARQATSPSADRACAKPPQHTDCMWA